MSWKETARRLCQEVEVWRRVLRHPQTPLLSKVLMGLAVGYLALPFDLIPDFIPILGLLDDLIIVPGFIWMALRFLPAEVLQDCRMSTHS